MMEHEVVTRRGWMTREEFLDLLGATNLAPGPNSTKMALFIGYGRGRWPGFLLVLGLAALVATFFVHEIVLLLVAGCVSAGVMVLKDLPHPNLPSKRIFSFPFPLLLLTAASSFSLGSLFLFFLKTGAVLFGSGYVLLAYLKADLVEHWHWLTSAQLLDAVAVGQFTPGPLSSTATFIGYVLGGLPGAAVATLGIFLPAFAFVALMGSVTVQFARPALTNGPTVTLFLVGVAILATIRINAAWLVLAGGLLGVAFG